MKLLYPMLVMLGVSIYARATTVEQPDDWKNMLVQIRAENELRQEFQARRLLDIAVAGQEYRASLLQRLAGKEVSLGHVVQAVNTTFYAQATGNPRMFSSDAVDEDVLRKKAVFAILLNNSDHMEILSNRGVLDERIRGMYCLD